MRRMSVRRLATATGLGLVLALTSAGPAAAQGTEVVDPVTGVVVAVADTVIGVAKGILNGLSPSSGG